MGVVHAGNAANQMQFEEHEGTVNAKRIISVLISSPAVGQAKIATTGTAVQLSSNATLLNGVIVTAKSANATLLTLGLVSIATTIDGTGNGYILEPGASVSFAVDNVNRLYINGLSGDIISFAGS